MNHGTNDRIGVTLVGPYPGPGGNVRGGVEAVTATLARSLAATGETTIRVVAPGDHDDEEVVDGIAVTRVQRPRLPGIATYWNVMRARLHGAVAATGPDIAHFQGLTGWTLGYDAPHIVTVHGIAEIDARYAGRRFPHLRSRLLGAVERRGRRRVPEVVFINRYVADTLGAQFRGRQWNIENPVEERFFSIHRDPRPVVLFAGRVIPIKNVVGLVAAFAAAAVDGAELHIAGALEDPGYAAACRRLVADVGLAGSVHFLGDLGVTGLAQEMTAAACLAVTSHQESAPLVVSEAMAAGVPVVAVDVGGVRHMVEDGRTGFVVPAGDVVVFARRLSQVLGDPSLAAGLGAAGQIVAERHRPQTVAAKTIAAYRTILSERDGYQPVET